MNPRKTPGPASLLVLLICGGCSIEPAPVGMLRSAETVGDEPDLDADVADADAGPVDLVEPAEPDLADAGEAGPEDLDAGDAGEAGPEDADAGDADAAEPAHPDAGDADAAEAPDLDTGGVDAAEAPDLDAGDADAAEAPQPDLEPPVVDDPPVLTVDDPLPDGMCRYRGTAYRNQSIHQFIAHNCPADYTCPVPGSDDCPLNGTAVRVTDCGCVPMPDECSVDNRTLAICQLDNETFATSDAAYKQLLRCCRTPEDLALLDQGAVDGWLSFNQNEVLKKAAAYCRTQLDECGGGQLDRGTLECFYKLNLNGLGSYVEPKCTRTDQGEWTLEARVQCVDRIEATLGHPAMNSPRHVAGCAPVVIAVKDAVPNVAPENLRNDIKDLAIEDGKPVVPTVEFRPKLVRLCVLQTEAECVAARDGLPQGIIPMGACSVANAIASYRDDIVVCR